MKSSPTKLRSVIPEGVGKAPGLLARLPLPHWTVRAAQVLAYVSLPLFPLFCLFVLDYMNFGKLEACRVFAEEHPQSLQFECLVMLALFLVLLLLFRWGAAAAGVMGAVSLLFGYINYTKIALNGDHFHPRDISMASSMDGLTSFISGNVPKWFVLGAVVIVLWVAVLALCRTQIPLRWFVRLPVVLAAAVLVGTMFSTNERSNRILERFGMSFMDAALQTSNYRANGFVGAFTINLLMGNIQAPEGYSQAAVQELLDGCEGRPADPGAPEYDVIVVLSESFFDVRTLKGVTFSENPLPNYDALLRREGVYSGTMYSTASGGGTVRPEFDILTGLTTDYLYDVPSPYELVDGPVESYVSNYREAGYHTVAIHPYDKTFYRRDEAYPWLGFDEFLGRDDLAGRMELSYDSGGHVTDASTLDAIRAVLDGAEEPTFLFAITMENHQPYEALPKEEISIRVDGPMLDQDTLDAVTAYTQGLANADRMLGELVDYIDQRERPTVLLFYGDHIPTLGTNRAAYYETGVVGGAVPYSQQLAYLYSTPFLICSNTGAVSGMLPEERGNQISTYYLLDVVAEMTACMRTGSLNRIFRVRLLMVFRLECISIPGRKMPRLPMMKQVSALI